MNDWNSNRLYNQSLNYLQGKGVPIDEKKSFTLNLEAAEAGLADAILAMGWFYFNGIGCVRDLEQALIWHKKSARRKEPRAMFNLGETYLRLGDFSKAKKWFKRATEHGHHRSKYFLGYITQKGLCVEADAISAMKYFQDAAKHNVQEAKRLFKIQEMMRRCEQNK